MLYIQRICIYTLKLVRGKIKNVLKFSLKNTRTKDNSHSFWKILHQKKRNRWVLNVIVNCTKDLFVDKWNS